MSQDASQLATGGSEHVVKPKLNGETRRRLGTALRLVYEATVDNQPIPEDQVDLLLQLRHRERDLRRAG